MAGFGAFGGQETEKGNLRGDEDLATEMAGCMAWVEQYLQWLERLITRSVRPESVQTRFERYTYDTVQDTEQSVILSDLHFSALDASPRGHVASDFFCVTA